RAEQDEVPAIALLAHQVGDPAVGAQVRQIADVAGAECFDQAEQHAAEHGSRDVADAAEHRGGKSFQAEDRAHGVLGDAVIGAVQHAGDGAERGADDEVAAMTRLTSTPISPATCGFCAVARIAVQSCVRYTSSASPPIRAMHTAMMAICTLVIDAPASV